MSRYTDEQNPPEPVVFTPEELTRKTRSHGIWLFVAYALVGVAIGLHFAPSAHPKPAPTVKNSQVTAVSTRLDSLERIVTSQRDTIAVIRRESAQAKADAANSLQMTESYGARVDEVHNQLSHLEINGSPAKK